MKTLFFILVLTLTLNSNAQITKGNWLVGGSAGYTNESFKYSDEDSYKREFITIKPNIGYFVRDKFAVGPALRFEKYDNNYLYGIGVFSRYYFLETDKTFNLFAQLHYDFVHNFSDLIVDDQTRNSNVYGGRVGQVVFFNDVVGLEFAIEYERRSNQDFKSDAFRAIIGFQIHLKN